MTIRGEFRPLHALQLVVGLTSCSRETLQRTWLLKGPGRQVHYFCTTITTKMANNDQQPTKIVNSSGYPFQIAIEHLVEYETRWDVCYKEHAWQNPEDDLSGFIDLVIDTKHNGFVFVIECKRQLETEWVFLSSSRDRPSSRMDTKFYSTDKQQRFFGYWKKTTVYPGSYEADFCVTYKRHGKKRDVPLENTAFSIRSATEAIALEEAQNSGTNRGNQPTTVGLGRNFLSMIVTNATLKLAKFDREKITTATGSLPDNTEYEEVPYIRFRKQLSLKTKLEDMLLPVSAILYGPRRWTQTKENSVFIVNSEHLKEFLDAFEY